MTTLPALTLWQPYPSLIAVGAKPLETRDYMPPRKYAKPGTVWAIHAARRPVELPEDDFHQQCAEWLGGPDWPQRVPRGAVVCLARLAGAYQVLEYRERGAMPAEVVFGQRITGSAELQRVYDDGWGNYAPGRWCWWFTQVRPLDPPVPASGQQIAGWPWELPAHLAHLATLPPRTGAGEAAHG